MADRPSFVVNGEVARLIPVVADTSKEQRAASILLAALRGVYEFRQSMLGSLGVRVGKRAELEAWTEVKLRDDGKRTPAKHKRDRPDGLISLHTGKKQWLALVEAKVGNAEVDEDQLKEYLAQAKEHKVDAVITVTNQFVAMPSHHPVKVPKNLTKGVELYHWSWMYVLTQATLLLEEGEVDSEDQEFLLSEVVRYFGHDSSGVTRFDSMNREWKEVVGKVKSGANLSKSAEDVENTVSSWHQEQRDLCLVMSRRLSRPVKLRLARAHRTDPLKRLKDDAEFLAKEHKLSCELEIPHAAAPLLVTADLDRRTITCSMRLIAPQDKKSTKARVNWLARQLKGVATDGMFVKAVRNGRAEDTQLGLAEVLQDPACLESANTNSVATAFEVFYMLDLAGKFAGSKVFIEQLEQAVPHFYEQVGQKLRPWVAPPPRISRRDPADAEQSDSEMAAEQSQEVDEE